MPAIRRVVESCLYAEDLDAAEAFYRDVLGLRVAVREEGRHVFFQAGDSMLLVFRPEATRRGITLPAHGADGQVHIALGIAAEEHDAWRDRLTAHGVAIEHEETWPRGGRSIYFRDPAGNSLELITPQVWGLPSGW